MCLCSHGVKCLIKLILSISLTQDEKALVEQLVTYLTILSGGTLPNISVLDLPAFAAPIVNPADQMIGKKEFGWNNFPMYWTNFERNMPCNLTEFFSGYQSVWVKYLDSNSSQPLNTSHPCFGFVDGLLSKQLSTIMQVMKYSQFGGNSRYFTEV